MEGYDEVKTFERENETPKGPPQIPPPRDYFPNIKNPQKISSYGNPSPPPTHRPPIKERKIENKNPYKIITIFLVALILIGMIVWFNVSFDNLSKKDFEVNNEVNVPENLVNITNEFPIENTLNTSVYVDFGDFTDEVVEEIVERILEELNITNST